MGIRYSPTCITSFKSHDNSISKYYYNSHFTLLSHFTEEIAKSYKRLAQDYMQLTRSRAGIQT